MTIGGIAGLRGGATLSAMKSFFGFLLILLLIGGGLKLAGQRLPVLDYQFGGLFFGPKVEVIQPDLHLP